MGLSHLIISELQQHYLTVFFGRMEPVSLDVFWEPRMSPKYTEKELIG
jgi:hypothetical protein